MQDWGLPILLAITLLGGGLSWAYALRQDVHFLPIKRVLSEVKAIGGQWGNRPEWALLGVGVFIFSFSAGSYTHLEDTSQVWGVGAAWLGGITMGMGFLGWGLAAVKRELVRAIGWIGSYLEVAAAQVVMLLGAFILAGLAGFLSVYDLNGVFSPAQWMAVGCWITSIGLAWAGSWKVERAAPQISWEDLAWMTILTTGAFLVRGLNTGHIPIAMTGDEGDFGLSALNFLQGKTNNFFSYGSHSFPSLFFYLQSVIIGWLGTTSQALRLPSALAGALTVGGVYALGRRWYGRRTGIFAGLVLAFSHFHIHFSRLGLNNVWDGLWFVCVLGLFWRGWETGKRSPMLLAGALLGFSQYFYANARLLPILVAAWIGLEVLKKRTKVMHRLPDLFLMGVMALIIILPQLVFYARHPDVFLAPVSSKSIFGEWLMHESTARGVSSFEVTLRQLKLGFLAYIYEPIQYFYEPQTAILRPVSAVLFVLGLGLLLLKWRESKTWVLLLWLVLMGISGAFSTTTPSAQRYIAAAPATAILIGITFARFERWLTQARPHYARTLSTTIFLVGFIISTNDLSFYFLDYTPRSYLLWPNEFLTQHIVENLKDKPTPAQLLYFGQEYSQYYSNPSLQYQTPDLEGLTMIFPWGSPDNPEPTSHQLIFIFLPGREDDLAAIQTQYPGGKLTREAVLEINNFYWIYEYQSATQQE